MLPFPSTPSGNGGTLGQIKSWNYNLLKNCNTPTILIKECTKEKKSFTHKSTLTTEQTKMCPKDATQHGFPDKGRMVTGPGLGQHGIWKNKIIYQETLTA